MKDQYSFLFSGKVVPGSTAHVYLKELMNTVTPWSLLLAETLNYVEFELYAISCNEKFVSQSVDVMSNLFENCIYGSEAAEIVYDGEIDGMQQFIGSQAQINFSVSKRIEEFLWNMSRQSSLAVVSKALLSWVRQ